MALTSRFEEALTFATQLHAKQLRKGTTIPYVAHLLAVTALVLENGGDEDEAIPRRFGNRVVAIVDGCTDADVTPKPPWRARKEASIAHLRKAPASVRLVSTADKLHNARAVLGDYRVMGETLWRRFHGGRTGTLWYYRAVVTALREGGTSPLIEELDRVVTELEQLAAEGI